MYPSEWKGNTENRHGIAIFMVDGERFEIELNSFEAMNKVSKMLEMANDQGRSFGAGQVLNAVITAGTSRANQLGA